MHGWEGALAGPPSVGTRVISREQPAGPLLDSLISALHYLPECAQQVRSAEDLPACLRKQTYAPGGYVWRAWCDGTRIWFVLGRCLGHMGEPHVQAGFFDVDGRLVAAGVWQRHDRQWMLEMPSADIVESAASATTLQQ